ncbi:hypothetical protein LX32DRAFT_642343 [Colletotrichum zoysiae]|uniref:Secreted protein n=1 Tax=Colletotrichum zoysiae TaxID=1216348 RepID=A0AAD9LYR9_9PEZI|nr:hypothetical protein LX32DRAFT_642343 [Colletotrichum zoysiae]
MATDRRQGNADFISIACLLLLFQASSANPSHTGPVLIDTSQCPRTRTRPTYTHAREAAVPGWLLAVVLPLLLEEEGKSMRW